MQPFYYSCHSNHHNSENVMKISTNITMNKKTALTHLDLSNNHIDDKGFCYHRCYGNL